jgi:glycosyltransferase involved in cell wall biosynthesis
MSVRAVCTYERDRRSLLSEKSLIICSGTWPSLDSGYGIAVRSALFAYSRHFRRVLFLGPSDLRRHPMVESEFPDVEWRTFACRRNSKLLRFVQSLFLDMPAIAVAYRQLGKALFPVLSDMVTETNGDGRGLVVLYEDLPVALWAKEVKTSAPSVTQVLRSHNVLTKGFAGLDRVGTPITRKAWAYELYKIAAFERAVVKSMDKFWVISEQDGEEYVARLGLQPDGVVGVAIDPLEVSECVGGNSKNVLYLGSADLRKGGGLKAFIEECWPKVVRAHPDARLLMAGRGTESYSRPEVRVEGIGYQAEESSFLARGHIFVNPQLIGAGIKLKSLVAMMRGKALVTTSTGAEGISGTNGEHFLVADEWNTFAKLLIELLDDFSRVKTIGMHGRRFVLEQYGQDRLNSSVSSLLTTVV